MKDQQTESLSSVKKNTILDVPLDLSKSSPLWHAIRVTYGREMKVKEFLDSIGVNSFVPLCYKEYVKNGKKVKKLTSAISNLIFIHSSQDQIDRLKRLIERTTPIRYIYDKSTRKPIVVPDKDMQHFITVSGTLDEQLVYLTEIDSHLRKGERVKVMDGTFAGVEGEVVRIKRNKRVLVSIEGVMAIATAHIPSVFLQKI